mmetsp:Transcript_67210/g.186197  ORF Transcript_67210/g.186197 Transcript_67210/m.186197 type:complete len:215 (+) Transcript_67210:161-805(+)
MLSSSTTYSTSSPNVPSEAEVRSSCRKFSKPWSTAAPGKDLSAPTVMLGRVDWQKWHNKVQAISRILLQSLRRCARDKSSGTMPDTTCPPAEQFGRSARCLYLTLRGPEASLCDVGGDSPVAERLGPALLGATGGAKPRARPLGEEVTLGAEDPPPGPALSASAMLPCGSSGMTVQDRGMKSLLAPCCGASRDDVFEGLEHTSLPPGSWRSLTT